MNDELTAALGVPVPVMVGGVTFDLLPLDILDLITLSREISALTGAPNTMKALDRLDRGDPAHLLVIAWLMLRKADPSLSQADRDDCRYGMTRLQAKMLLGAVGNIGDELGLVLRLSGLTSTGADEAEGNSKNAPAPKGGPSARALKSRSSSSGSGADLLD